MAMTELNSELAPHILAAATANAGEAAAALARALGGEFVLAVGNAAPMNAADAAIDGAGLLVVLQFGDAALAAALPASSGLIPDWQRPLDATGESKLATLAQELSLLLVPETLEASSFQARYVDDLAASLRRGGVGARALRANISVSRGEPSGTLSLVWPLPAPGEVFAPTAEPAAVGEPSTPQQATQRGLETLPKYSQSLLKIRVPVSVQLAGKKEIVQEVISMAPGSIIKFDKGCDQLLQMIVGEHLIAEGEAVKIGDKFGFRVTSMVLPRERFTTVKKQRRA